MCDQNVMEALGNGQAEDLRMQGLGIKNCMEMLDGIRKQLQEIPTRGEVRDMIHSSLQIHVESCDAARDGNAKPAEPDKFKLGVGKVFGIEAQGSKGVLFGACLGVGAAALLFKVAPYLLGWLEAASAK